MILFVLGTTAADNDSTGGFKSDARIADGEGRAETEPRGFPGRKGLARGAEETARVLSDEEVSAVYFAVAVPAETRLI